MPSMPLLLPAFVIFWLGTVATPALLGAHPNLSHNYVYSLIIGMAAVLVSGPERDQAFKAARNALLLFMAASLLLIALMAIFALGNFATALAPGYLSLNLLRFLTGLPHGTYFGVAALVAASLAPQGQRHARSVW